MFLPNRNGRDANAPEPRKEKQKRYDYRCRVLIVHSLGIFICLFTEVLHKTPLEVTQKLVEAAELGRQQERRELFGTANCRLELLKCS